MASETDTGRYMGRALLLLDFQHDFLAGDGRLPVARNQVPGVIAAANAAIERAVANGDEIIAVGNEFPRTDWVANLFRSRSAIRGSPGARWDERIVIGGAAYFPKWTRDAFGNPTLEQHLRERGVGHLIIAGLYAGVCVSATTKGALIRGFRVSLLAAAIADRSNRARDRAIERLVRRGASIDAG